MFSAYTMDAEKDVVKKNELLIWDEAWNEKYLGLPVYVGRSKKNTFAYLENKMWCGIQGWQEKMLSKVGIFLFVKHSTTQAIPSYAMSCFYLTKGFCDELSTMIARFWWSQQDKDNKIHWIGWPKLVKSKGQGGLGFRDLHSFNLAILFETSLEIVTGSGEAIGLPESRHEGRLSGKSTLGKKAMICRDGHSDRKSVV